MFPTWFLFGNNPLQVSRFFRMYIWCVEFSDRSERHIKMGFSLPFLYGCSVTRNTPFSPTYAEKFYFNCFCCANWEKKQLTLLTYLRLDWRRLNWKPAEIVRWEITLIIFLPWELQDKIFDGRERKMLWVAEQL